MATTTNYGWTTPDDTALVKDGAAAIRTLGSSIDTTLKTQIDAQIPDSLLTTKGDIIAATGASTPARLGVGTNGQALIADSTTATGLKWDNPSSGSVTLLTTTSLSGSSSTTVSSINQTYRDLIVEVLGAQSGTAGAITMRVNGITTSNYKRSNITMGFTSIGGGTDTEYYLDVGAPTTSNNNFVQLTLPDYARANTLKTWTGLASIDSQNSSVQMNGNCITLKSAVTSITIRHADGFNLTAGTLYIYGVK